MPNRGLAPIISPKNLPNRKDIITSRLGNLYVTFAEFVRYEDLEVTNTTIVAFNS